MIIIKNGERQIYHPQNPNLMLLNPKLTLEDNGAGNLTFQIYKSNMNYSTVRKLYPVISVIRDGKTLFKGRVISDKKDFYNGKIIEAEGKLAFFNDSYMEPFSFSGSPMELFRMIIENHNAMVKEWQQFKVGEVTVVDNNDYIVRSSENIINSWDTLKEKCFQSSLGGHIRIRYEKDGDYVDWLADYDTVSSQNIEFAKNMLDISSEVDATETYTAIRPSGAEVDGKKIDISSVNDGKNYLINEEKAEEYGIIYAPESESTWPDVTLPENLLKKAKAKLHNLFAALRETYEIKAVDLHLTDAQIEALNIYEYVPVVSKPHGIDGRYLLYKAEINITSPQNTMYYLGATKRTFSDANGIQYVPVDIPQDISVFRNDAKYVSEEKAAEILSNYSKTEEMEVIISQYIEELPAGKDGLDGLSAYEIAVQNGFNGYEQEWIESLKGEPGSPGKDGEPGESGKDGLSAYEVAKKNGFSGTEQEWVDSLKKAKDDTKLPLTGGTLENNINPLLALKRKSGAYVGLDFVNDLGQLIKLEAYKSDADAAPHFRISDITNGIDNTRPLFEISKDGRTAYDAVAGCMKPILLEGEALPLSGGTLTSGNTPQLTLKRNSKNYSAGLHLDNESRGLIEIRGGLENGDPGKEAYFSLYDLDAGRDGSGKLLELFHVSENLRNIYDANTKSLKRILVEGEAIPISGGTLTGVEPLTLKHLNSTFVGLALNPLFTNGDDYQVHLRAYHAEDLTYRDFRVDEVVDGVQKSVFRVGRDYARVYDKETDSLQDIITKNKLLNTIYPIGAVYTSANNANPSTNFGGTWESMGTMQQAGTTCYMWKRTK